MRKLTNSRSAQQAGKPAYRQTASRATRWLAIAGLALGTLLSPQQAGAQTASPELRLDTGPLPHPGHGDVRPFFTKRGVQRGCESVVYDLRFGVRGDPEKLRDAGFADKLRAVRLDFSDQLPAGLAIVHVSVSGDGTDAAGGPLPDAVISSAAGANDTARIGDFRLSAADLDGFGPPSERYIDIKVTAKIDRAAFPSATVVANQGFMRIGVAGAPSIEIPSHDPALPDDASFATGDPTRIIVDVTGCSPPPPPPSDAPCFTVSSGDVDCVPGGGALIYHMPVGPELAGKWVQLRTTTPGVSVEPALRLVPAGGGVLDFRLEGARPGDLVHLIVTGIETYAGPAEGVGLCCTQTVDIVVPPDLKCPPDEKQPDLKVEKRADVARCTPEGGCDFTIRVTNVGEAPYTGPIVLSEVTAPGSAAVVSGPNPPWTCTPGASPLACTHPATTLNPGEWRELKLGFAPGAGWPGRVIRNCAAYDYARSGKPAFGSAANDKACASIQICRRGDRDCGPPVEKRVDLRITKVPRSAVCTVAGVCSFTIRVFNNGSDTYSGPLTVVDTYPTGAPTSSDFSPMPPWSCVAEAGDRFRCDHPGVVLVPGASVPISVVAHVRDGYGESIRNCGAVQAIEGETDLANNQACAVMRIPNHTPGEPKLAIEKSCGQAAGADSVRCRITVRNSGTAAPSGPVRVADAATLVGAGTPAQVLTVAPDAPGWICGPVPADTLSCRIPGASLAPGSSRHFDVTVAVTPNQRFRNCARGSFGPAPGDDVVRPFGEACAEGGAAIAVQKTGDRECRVGEPCNFTVTLRNLSGSAFDGPLRIADAIGVDGIGRLQGLAVTAIEPPFGCADEPTTLPLSCVANVQLGAGEARAHKVTVVIPPGGALAGLSKPASAENCFGAVDPMTPVVGGAGGGAGAGKAEGSPFACHSFTIADPVVKQCSEGFVLNAAGRCVCPEGTSFRNGQCSGKPDKPPVPPTKPTQCTLLPGQIRTGDGRCVCPRGTDLVKGRCVAPEPPPVRQCKLLPGQIRTEDGRCICPRGTDLVKGRCVAPEPPPVRQCKLLPGQIRTEDGRCICPRGTRLANGECRRQTTECPAGTSLVRGRCVIPPRAIECRRGQVLRGGQCVTLEPERCPRGTVGTPPDCRRPSDNGPRVREPVIRIDPGIIAPEILKRLPNRRNENGATRPFNQ